MKNDDFTKLVTFWSLRSLISDGEDLGVKIVDSERLQIKRIKLSGRNFTVSVTYSVSVSTNDVRILTTDVYDIHTGISDMVYGEDCLKILEKL